MNKHIIWDFDGTLGYREGMWTGALLEVLRRGAPDCAATADHLRPHLKTGYPWHDPHRPFPIRSADQWWGDLAPVFERAFVAVGVTGPQAQELAREVRWTYTAPTHWRLFDDTLPTLARLSEAGWTHWLLSNHVPELPALLHHLQIDGFFARVFNSAQTSYEKPHPQAFLTVLEAVGDTETVWMIGDNAVADIAGAAAVGIPGILVRKRHADAIYQCDALSQVPAMLQTEAARPVNGLQIRSAEPSDAQVIQAVVEGWWGRPLESDMLAKFFLTHFRETCLVAEKNHEMVGFLVGFLSQTLADEAYIRLVVVHPQHRGGSVGRALYERFFAVARQHGRCVIRSVTSPANKASVAFHTRLGFTLEPQEQAIDGMPVCRDYHGRAGTDRILFVKTWPAQ